MRRPHLIEALCKETQTITGLEDVFPSTFPANATSACVVISLIGGTSGKDTVKYATLQVVTRADRPNHSYDISMDIQKYFTSLCDVRLISGEVVIHCKEQHPYPMYLGEDENRRHLYSTNYSMVLSDE